MSHSDCSLPLQIKQSSSAEQELKTIRLKYESEIKKNGNLLKMNQRLMQENEEYQKGLMSLKKWYTKFILTLSSSVLESEAESNLHEQQNVQEEHQKEDESFIDFEQCEEFIQKVIEQIEKKVSSLQMSIETYSQNNHNHTLSSLKILNTETEILSNRNENYPNLYSENLRGQSLSNTNNFKATMECENCARWKDMYSKETNQTVRLQKFLEISEWWVEQKQVNMVKLKEDISALLESYLKLYRQEVGHKIVNENNQKTDCENLKNSQNKNGKSKSKEKTIKSKPLAQTTNSNKGAFSKNKSNNKPSEPFSTLLKSDQNLDEINKVLSSYCECYQSIEEENIAIKQQLKELSEIVGLYRQKEMNRVLYMQKN